MAIAAFLAMLHDLAVTVGIYAIFGFQVTPDTVIAVLTILGYSLYDTVVVFDRVRDNTKPFAASGRMTYSAMVNLSMNQTLARSINTSMVAILPVLCRAARRRRAARARSRSRATAWPSPSGLLSGAYSSIFIASPLLAILKEREPKYVAIRQRLLVQGRPVDLVQRAGRGAPRRCAAPPPSAEHRRALDGAAAATAPRTAAPPATRDARGRRPRADRRARR